MQPLWPAVIAAVLAVPALAQTNWPPDHSKANINGKEGMLIFPADEKHNPIEPRDCVVQLAPTDSLEKRFTHGCGEWFLPPGPGAYRCWVEMEGRVSAVQTLLRESGESRFQGQGFTVLHETVPAGFVSVQHEVPPGHTVRYLNLDRPGYGFSLRVPAERASRPAPMPPGRVIAGIFSEATDEAVAHSRPIAVETGKTTRFRIEAPRDGSDLLVMLRKPPGSRAPVETKLRVRSESLVRDADVLHQSGNWYVALWYGLPATRVTLSLDAPGLELKEQKIQLATGRITTVRQELLKAGGNATGEKR